MLTAAPSVNLRLWTLRYVVLCQLLPLHALSCACSHACSLFHAIISRALSVSQPPQRSRTGSSSLALGAHRSNRRPRRLMLSRCSARPKRRRKGSLPSTTVCQHCSASKRMCHIVILASLACCRTHWGRTRRCWCLCVSFRLRITIRRQ